MSPQIQTTITQRLLALKSAAAVKIGLLLYQSGGASIASTPRILSKTLNCSYRALMNALDELAANELVFLEKDGFSVYLRLNTELQTDPTVYESNTPVYQVHSLSGKIVYLSAIDPVPPDCINDTTNTVPKSTNLTGTAINIAPKSMNIAPKSLNNALSADCTDDEDDNISSSSSKESVAKAASIVANALNDVFSSKLPGEPLTEIEDKKLDNARREACKVLDACLPPKTLPDKIKELLNEIDMGRHWVVKQVLDAGEGLPEEEILEIVRRCIMHAARTPAYIVKALTFRKVELAADRDKQADYEQRLQYEIKLGEKLLAGERLKFEQLAQSKHWTDFAHPLFDAVGKCCVLKSEYREPAETRLKEMRGK